MGIFIRIPQGIFEAELGKDGKIRLPWDEYFVAVVGVATGKNDCLNFSTIVVDDVVDLLKQICS